MCVWQLTFYEPAAEAMGSSGVVHGLVDMARQATKEKVPHPFSSFALLLCHAPVETYLQNQTQL